MNSPASKKKLISLVVPLYNEEKNIPVFLKSATEILEKLSSEYTYEIIFIDDGSTDQSLKALRSINNPQVKFLSFLRNFGKEVALTAGLNHAQGDAVIMIDIDMQHPLELIPEFVKEWEKGANLVIGVRIKGKNIGWFSKLTSIIFYKLFNLVADISLFEGETDFRLLSRTVVDEFNKFAEKERITRALINWLGFEKVNIEFVPNPRLFGNQRYGFWKRMRLMQASFISHSYIPLKAVGLLGMVITFLSGTLGLFIFIEKFILKDPLRLYITSAAALSVLLIFLVGVLLISIGLVALYIERIHNEIVNRPLYILRTSKI